MLHVAEIVWSSFTGCGDPSELCSHIGYDSSEERVISFENQDES